MVLQVASANDVKVYHVTAGKSIPDWLVQAKKKSLRYDQGAAAPARLAARPPVTPLTRLDQRIARLPPAIARMAQPHRAAPGL